MIPILSQADLSRANIQVAWSLAATMTSAQYEQLCRVTVAQWRRERETIEHERARIEQVCHG